MSNLVLLQKCYDFYLYLDTILIHFPKSEKFVLSKRLKNKFLDFVDHVERANLLIEKKYELVECDIALKQFKLLIRIAKDTKRLRYSQINNLKLIIGVPKWELMFLK